MAKRKMTERQLANLELANPQNNFNNSEVARSAQQKSVEARKENKRLAQVAEEKLNKAIEGITFQEVSIDKLIEYVKSSDAKPEIIIKILEFLRDTSGQKPSDKQEIIGDVNLAPPVFNILPVKPKDEL